MGGRQKIDIKIQPWIQIRRDRNRDRETGGEDRERETEGEIDS